MWDLPRPGLKPVSPALAGGFLTTVPPGKAKNYFNTKTFLVLILSTLIMLKLKEAERKKAGNS